jgi:adenosylcobyric acid synthase
LRGAVLARIGGSGGAFDHGKVVDAALDDLAEALEAHLDFDALLAVAQGAAR